MKEDSVSYQAPKSCQSQGAVTVYQQTTAEKVETSTVLLTINVAGDSGLSLEILKGVRLSNAIRKSASPSTNVNIPPLKPIREVRKRASAVKKSRLFMGDATSSDISTDPIPEKSPEKILLLGLTGRRFEFKVLKLIMLKMGRLGPLVRPFLNVSHYPRKTNNNRGKKTIEDSGESCRQQ